MLTKRVIPCLDVVAGRVVKGVKFRHHADVGDPVDLAERYEQDGADELVFYDIKASVEDRATLIDVANRTAERVFIPFTAGGGIRSIVDINDLLAAGADKVSINTAAVLDPSLISRGAEKFGSQCIVVAIDAERVPKSDPPRWELRTYTGANGGRATGIDAIEWAIRATQLGSGELVVNSIDSDGTGLGYDLDLLSAISASVNVPVIASGGVGTLQHFADGLTIGKADAVLAASVFHYRQLSISQVKSYLSARGIRVRPV